MKTYLSLLTCSLAALLGLLPAGVLAHGDHDQAPTVTTSIEGASPRVVIQAHGLELVGVLEHDRLSLYLDHWNDNSPVKDARLALKLDGAAVEVEQTAPGTFEAHLQNLPDEGAISLQATVIRGDSVERLKGTLARSHAEHADDDAPPPGKHLPFWLLGGLAVLALLFWAVRHARSDSRAS